jgi:hypothetical protein
MVLMLLTGVLSHTTGFAVLSQVWKVIGTFL